jgi:hypothetical protein
MILRLALDNRIYGDQDHTKHVESIDRGTEQRQELS